MKMNVKVKKTEFEGFDYIEYEDDTLSMTVFQDGSGSLCVDEISFYADDGTHASRVQELKRIKRIVNKALKTLEDIENPKIYFKKKAKKKRKFPKVKS